MFLASVEGTTFLFRFVSLVRSSQNDILKTVGERLCELRVKMTGKQPPGIESSEEDEQSVAPFSLFATTRQLLVRGINGPCTTGLSEWQLKADSLAPHGNLETGRPEQASAST